MPRENALLKYVARALFVRKTNKQNGSIFVCSKSDFN